VGSLDIGEMLKATSMWPRLPTPDGPAGIR